MQAGFGMQSMGSTALVIDPNCKRYSDSSILRTLSYRSNVQRRSKGLLGSYRQHVNWQGCR